MDEQLTEYLEDILTQAKNNPIILGGRYDPRNISLDRTEYVIHKGRVVIGNIKNGDEYFDFELGEISKIATDGDIEKARKVRRRNLENKFHELLDKTENIQLLQDYAKSISYDSYYELAEEIVGKVLILHPQNIYSYHILSRMNVDRARVQKDKGKRQYYFSIAESLTERCLEFIDEVFARIMQDKFEALNGLGKDLGPVLQKMDIIFSRKYGK